MRSTRYAHPEHGGGRAADYGRFLLDELKPAVDDVLRTRPGSGHTVVAGRSSSGTSSTRSACWLRYGEPVCPSATSTTPAPGTSRPPGPSASVRPSPGCCAGPSPRCDGIAG
ncbi:alpha/beta hydrolase-fold protein [Serinicoccus sp. CNJ-927]|uniref:alpha/beta hydrolase-fold protein n=1 Tax=Serinicoccus sp. CNJ-927 TaxID=1904970 RepID=UPI00096A92BD